jgi:hypothetical protein
MGQHATSGYLHYIEIDSGRIPSRYVKHGLPQDGAILSGLSFPISPYTFLVYPGLHPLLLAENIHCTKIPSLSMKSLNQAIYGCGAQIMLHNYAGDKPWSKFCLFQNAILYGNETQVNPPGFPCATGNPLMFTKNSLQFMIQGFLTDKIHQPHT